MKPAISFLVLLVCCLLVAVFLNRPAPAQPNPQYHAAPTVTGISVPIVGDHMIRVWSDGLVEERQYGWIAHPGVGHTDWWFLEDEWETVEESKP
jgi:hypothetical protein